MNWKALINLIASTVIPIAFPPLAPAVPFIVHGIQVAEDMGGTNTEKLNKSIEIANAGAQATNKITGKETINLDAMNAVISSGISAVVDAANVVNKSTNK